MIYVHFYPKEKEIMKLLKYKITFLRHIDVMIFVNYILGSRDLVYFYEIIILVDLLTIESVVSQNLKF